MFESRVAIIFDLIFVKNETKIKDSSAHASTISFCKNVNIHFHAIFFFNIFLLFMLKRRKKDENKNCYNNNNNENK